MDELVLPQGAPLLVPDAEEQEDLADVRPPFVPNIKLIHSVSQQREEPGINEGDFLFGEINLGSSFVFAVVGRRQHAIRFENNVKVKESFNKDSPIFKEIRYGSETRTLRNTAGHDFLMWIPSHNIFAAYLFGRNYTFQAARTILMHMTPPANRPEATQEEVHTNVFTLRSEYRKIFRCHCPMVEPFLESIDMPSQKDFERTAANFYAPVKAEVVVEESTTNR